MPGSSLLEIDEGDGTEVNERNRMCSLEESRDSEPSSSTVFVEAHGSEHTEDIRSRSDSIPSLSQ
jgi:hypothetical protein